MSRHGSKFCPVILPLSSDSTEVLVGSGQEKYVELRIQNLEDFQASLNCEFTIDDSIPTLKLKAERFGNDSIRFETACIHRIIAKIN